MVRHVIVWTLKDEYTDAQKADIKAGIKEDLLLRSEATSIMR